MTRKRSRQEYQDEPGLPVEAETMVLPHDLDAERAVLGAALVNTAAIARVQQRLTADDFFRRAHQEVFAAMVRLADRRRTAVDLVMLVDELRRAKALDEVGGPAYVASLTDGVPHSTNVAHYAGIVKEHAIRRALIRTAADVLSRAYDTGVPVAELVAETDRAMIALQHGAASDRLVDLRTTAMQLVDVLEQRRQHRGQVTGIETGFPGINELTMGWQRGDMIVLAARPSIGKTAFILNCAIAAARQGHRVLIESLEMRRSQLELRLLSSISGVPLTRLLNGYIGEEDFERLGPANSELLTLPIFVDDRGRQTVWDIRASARRLKSEGGLDLLIVDYVQLVSGSLERRGANRNEELTDISRRLKELADELQCPVMVLSQLNRDAAARSDKRPILSDLRDSGAFEQDADVVSFLHRKDHRLNGLTHWILEKARNGPTGYVPLSIDRATQTFSGGEDLEAEQADMLPPPPAKAKPEPPAKPPKGWRRGR